MQQGQNEKGISATSIRWLARIFGCNDPVATGEWQIELTAAQSRLSTKRRELKKAENTITQSRLTQDATGVPTNTSLAKPLIINDNEGKRRTLARRSEALFSEGSLLNLPACASDFDFRLM
ncbi:hypothetical protein DKP76_18690 [Falsochrobactrum shanghaiense]|uniref:Uncharacterized protein n=1 Tax=Falsochrobactrum shanghaiense TaxID=2201899 RepID=A0A316JB25_9HYPH|nr:hypothetical protein DKP76_18690 [Falsochrobactrum shanghaiense]